MTESIRPNPDPTTLTTANQDRESRHLRELLETRLNNMDKAVEAARLTTAQAAETARITSTQAVDKALATSDKAVIELDSNITRRLQEMNELTEAKFVTYRVLLDGQADRVALALAASDKAVSKNDTFNEKRFELMSEQLNELKSTLDKRIGAGVGLQQGWGYLVGAAGVGIGIIGVVVAFVVR